MSEDAPQRVAPPRLITSAILVIAAVTAGVAMEYLEPVLVPFVFAFFIVAVVSPLMDLLIIRFRFHRLLALSAAFAVVLAASAVFSLVLYLLAEAIMLERQGYLDIVRGVVEGTARELSAWGIEMQARDLSAALTDRIPGMIRVTLEGAVGIFTQMTFVLVFVFFMLGGRRPHVKPLPLMLEINRKIRHYAFAKILVSALTGTSVGVILHILDLRLATVFGFLAFLLNFIPTLGSIVATILPLPIAIDQYESGWLILAAILLPGLANFFVAYFIEPKVMGHELQVHPVVIILALVILGLLWGVAGAFLAMPMAAILRITLMESDTLAPVADLMGGKLPGADPGGEAGSAKDAAGREGE